MPGTVWLFSPNVSLDTGSNGWGVFDLQGYLRSYGRAVNLAPLNTLSVTGQWNAATTAALNAFIRHRGFQPYNPRGEFSSMEQARLLRALQERRVALTGETSRPLPWDVSAAVWRAHTQQAGGVTAAYRARLRAAGSTAVAPPPTAATPRASTTATTVRAGSRGVYEGSDLVNNTTLLKVGMCGDLVRMWEYAVQGLTSTSVAPTGVFDAAFKTRVQAAQRVLGVTADGAIGNDTRTAFRRRLVAVGYTIDGRNRYTAAPCSGGAAPAASAAVASSGADVASAGAAGSAPAVAGGLGGGMLDFFGEYGPVMAIGLGVAAFAMLGGGGGRRR